MNEVGIPYTGSKVGVMKLDTYVLETLPTKGLGETGGFWLPTNVTKGSFCAFDNMVEAFVFGGMVVAFVVEGIIVVP